MENKIINSLSVKEIEIKRSLIEIVNFQLARENNTVEYPDLLLWINTTNGYVSCHWYNHEEEVSNEEDIYSVLELPELFKTLLDKEESFYEFILKILKSVGKHDLMPIVNNLKIFETWEINEPELLLKL
ncbi:MAG: hypothetical protein KDC67_13340 [Ignavibacteriae bacterium]|nr:hypothetical protein [Ignavibacteriota bacterium]